MIVKVIVIVTVTLYSLSFPDPRPSAQALLVTAEEWKRAIKKSNSSNSDD